MRKIVVVPFASKLHGKEYYTSVYEVLRRHVEATGLDIEVPQIVTEEKELEALARRYSDALPILVALTGGVSRLIRRFASLAGYERVIIFGHGEHNSLPSAISAKVKLELDGLWTWLFHCKDINSTECRTEIQRMARIAFATATILNSKILLIGPEEKPENAEDFETRFGATVDVVPMQKFVERLDAVKRDYVEHFIKAMEGVEFRLPKEKLEDVGKIYGLLREFFENGGYDGIAMDCFPYLVKYGVTPCLAFALLNSEGMITACEGDLNALTLMLISKILTGFSGWIANASAFEGDKAYFAHCTIALNMVQKPLAVSHMESGYPYALSGALSRGVYTIVSLSPDFTMMTMTIGRLVDSGLIYNTMCRTQAVFEMDFKTAKLPLIASANHHVIVPGDVREELKAVATLLGIDYADYVDLAATV